MNARHTHGTHPVVDVRDVDTNANDGGRRVSGGVRGDDARRYPVGHGHRPVVSEVVRLLDAGVRRRCHLRHRCPYNLKSLTAVRHQLYGHTNHTICT